MKKTLLILMTVVLLFSCLSFAIGAMSADAGNKDAVAIEFKTPVAKVPHRAHYLAHRGLDIGFVSIMPAVKNYSTIGDVSFIAAIGILAVSMMSITCYRRIK